MKKLNTILCSSNWNAHLEIHDYFLGELKSVLFLLLNETSIVPSYQKLLKLRNYLFQHIQFEINEIYPLYKSDVKDYISYCKPDYYDDDHKKIKLLFNELTISFFFDSKKELSFKIYQLFDLLEHHDKRENDGLYTALNNVLNDRLKNEILARFSNHITESDIAEESVIHFFEQYTISWQNYCTDSLIEKNGNIDDLHSNLESFFNFREHKLASKFLELIEKIERREDPVKQVYQLKRCESVLKAFLKDQLLGNVGK